MASTRRVTVRASRTRPGLQTRCKAPPWRAKEMESFTSTEIPELSIWGISFRSTMILRAPLCVSFCTNVLRCSLGSPMVSLPCTVTKWIPSASRTVTSKGGCRVIERFLKTCTRNLVTARRFLTRQHRHYTMIAMKNKPKGAQRARHHQCDVTPSRAPAIQETLRKPWSGEDLLPRIRLVAGLDAPFVLLGSQALKKRP